MIVERVNRMLERCRLFAMQTTSLANFWTPTNHVEAKTGGCQVLCRFGGDRPERAQFSRFLVVERQSSTPTERCRHVHGVVGHTELGLAFEFYRSNWSASNVAGLTSTSTVTVFCTGSIVAEKTTTGSGLG